MDLAAAERDRLRLDWIEENGLPPRAIGPRGEKLSTLREDVDGRMRLGFDGILAIDDSKRLRWMQENKVGVLTGMVDDPDGEPTIRRWQCEGAGLETARPTLIEAIDAAMFAEKEEV